MDAGSERKARGAFFTPEAISGYLVNWALRRGQDSVLEPSCGEAGFLLPAARRLRELGGSPKKGQLCGVEIFDHSALAAERLLGDEGFEADIAIADFFEFESNRTYEAVVGNPPFVRYQNFSGAARARGLQAALKQGVRLSGLASSWAAFVVKASLHVAPQGRLALVLPAELLSVGYATEIRNFLLRRYSKIRLIVFEERVFPEVQEDVLLLLAEGEGGADCFQVYQTRNADSLSSVELAEWTHHTPGINDKWTPALIAEEAFAIYKNTVESHFESLSKWGSAYLGSVTGNNAYFALSAEEALSYDLPSDELVKILPPGSEYLRGFELSATAWKRAVVAGAKGYLFFPGRDPSTPAKEYIEAGSLKKIDHAYKCRVRSPWWQVPMVRVPDLFLTYMNHDRPRIVTNDANLSILNSVYGITLSDGRKRAGRDLLPIAALNSVTLLGAEVIGRSYGGGLLKMEPREADNLPLPSLRLVDSLRSELLDLKPWLARALRRGNLSDAVSKVDHLILSGMKHSELLALRTAREILFGRRRARSRVVKTQEKT